MASALDVEKTLTTGKDAESMSPSREGASTRLPLKKRVLGVLWDSLDKSPEERAFIAKIDWWILSYACISYFVKYLDQTNVGLSLPNNPA